MTGPKSLWRHIHHITNVQAKIVCLDIGSNDLCHIDVSPDNLVHAIGQFVDQCHNLGTRLVIVTEILPRANVHDQQYNENVYQANILLKTATASHSHCIFWEHSGQNFTSRFLTEFINMDGVHVNAAGLRHYYRSIRGSILFAETTLLVCIVNYIPNYLYCRLPSYTYLEIAKVLFYVLVSILITRYGSYPSLQLIL